MHKRILQGVGEAIEVLHELALHTETGEAFFRCGEDHNAKVYLYRGDVVWAFAAGQKESFQSILLREGRMDKETLREGIRSARERGVRDLDEILEFLGISRVEQRRELVKRHTSAALNELSTWGRGISQFNPTAHTGGKPPAALSLSELVPQIGSEQAIAVSSIARRSGSEEISGILRNIRDEVDRFLSVVIVDGSTGMTIAYLSEEDVPEADTASAYYRELSQAARKTLEVHSPNHGDAKPLEELLLVGSRNLLLLHTIGNSSSFIALAAEKESNPAMARLILNRYSGRLAEILG